MLKRAASSARSGWLASHIRTKQSNWLDQNVQEMETRVQAMIKLIDAEGDSFAKRAEIYYKRRPELIHLLEEFYKEYRGLADRYDHVSSDLHNARSTIATAFPEQAPFVAPTETPPPSKAIKVDSGTDPAQRSNPASSKNPPPPPPPSMVAKQNSNAPKKVEASGSNVSGHAMDAAAAQKEIDKLQKQILALLMEKEFVKSSYEVGLAKYWETEEQTLELQAKMCFLQEEYGLGSNVDAEEEHAILAVTALNSCEQVLGSLQEEQKKAMVDAKIESERIKAMEEKLKSIKEEFIKQHPDGQKMEDERSSDAHHTAVKTLEEEVCNLRKENSEYQGICHKLVKQLEINVNDSVSGPENSQLIDELVSKVVELESEVSTQIVQIMRMKSETDHLQDNLQKLQEDRILLLNDPKTMTERIRDLEDELIDAQGLNLYIEEQKSQLQEAIAETRSKLKDLRAKFRNHGDDDNGDQNSVLDLPQEKDANESSVSYQNHKEDESSCLVGSETDSIVEPQNEKGITEYSNSHQNHNEHDFPAPVGSGNQLVLQPQQEKDDADEYSVSLQEGEIAVQSGSESSLGLPREGKNFEQSTFTETEGDLKDGMLTGERDFMVESHEEIVVKPKSEIEEHKVQEEFVLEGDHHVEQGMHPETDDHVTTTANGDHKAKHDGQAEKDHKSSNIAGGLENLSLDLIDSQAWISFLEGMEDREKTLVTEYTSILRSYKETKKKFSELEKQNHDIVAEKLEKIRLLETESSRKDGEIHSLKQKLAILHTDSELPNATTRGTTTEAPPPTEKEINMVFSQDTGPPSAMEEKFRHEIDSVLDDNLEFWLRFSASFHQIKKFQTTIEEAQVEAAKLQKSKEEGNNMSTDTNAGSKDHQTVKSSVEAIQKQMTDLQGELIIWSDQNALLKEELKHRFSSLCNIQDELSQVSKAKFRKGEAQLTEYQAAKFQGEVSNMQQENNKVADELQAGLDHVRGLQLELEKTLLKLKENFGLQESRRPHHNINHMRNTITRTRVPLRSFLQIGGKPPKKPSLFSCVHPAFQRQR